MLMHDVISLPDETSYDKPLSDTYADLPSEARGIYFGLTI